MSDSDEYSIVILWHTLVLQMTVQMVKWSLPGYLSLAGLEPALLAF